MKFSSYRTCLCLCSQILTTNEWSDRLKILMKWQAGFLHTGDCETVEIIRARVYNCVPYLFSGTIEIKINSATLCFCK